MTILKMNLKLNLTMTQSYYDLCCFFFKSGKLETMNDGVFFGICACQNEETYVWNRQLVHVDSGSTVLFVWINLAKEMWIKHTHNLVQMPD